VAGSRVIFCAAVIGGSARYLPRRRPDLGRERADQYPSDVESRWRRHREGRGARAGGPGRQTVGMRALDHTASAEAGAKRDRTERRLGASQAEPNTRLRTRRSRGLLRGRSMPATRTYTSDLNKGRAARKKADGSPTRSVRRRAGVACGSWADALGSRRLHPRHPLAPVREAWRTPVVAGRKSPPPGFSGEARGGRVRLRNHSKLWWSRQPDRVLRQPENCAIAIRVKATSRPNCDIPAAMRRGGPGRREQEDRPLPRHWIREGPVRRTYTAAAFGPGTLAAQRGWSSRCSEPDDTPGQSAVGTRFRQRAVRDEHGADLPRLLVTR